MAGDEGSAPVVFVVLMTTVLIAMAGLVIDGGYALDARQEAANVAEQAARAGADALSEGSLRGGGPVKVDPARAEAAAKTYLQRVGHAGTVTVDGASVTVTVRVARKTSILSVVGVNSITVLGSASARSIGGIASEER
jgi:Flp pilus assembly protein TadG